MLPIFRMISVGGVLLAITILGLALTPPGVTRARFAAIDAPATGALIDRGTHPEWRQFIIQAALRRADAINELRELPDTAVRLPQIPDVAPPYVPPTFPELSAGKNEKLAGLPAQADGDPRDVTGAIKTAPETIPIEIGETSSIELPAVSPDDRPPAIRMPLSETPEPATRISAVAPVHGVKASEAPRKKEVSRRHFNPAKPESAKQPEPSVPPPFNILQAFFESLLRQPAPEKPAKRAKVHGRAKAAAKATHTAAQ
jgi:hypothetical protein